MKIYMLRHGQTDWNVQRKVQGSADVPLNENGRQVADEIAHVLGQISFDRIFSSPLVRAKETAEYVARYQNQEIILDDRLKEIDFGAYEGITEKELKEIGIPFQDMFFLHPDQFQPAPGGETIIDTVNRAKAFLKEIVEPLEKEADNLLIVSHGELLHAMLVFMLNRPLSQLWGERKTRNCETHIVSFEDGQYHLLEEARVFRKGEVL